MNEKIIFNKNSIDSNKEFKNILVWIGNRCADIQNDLLGKSNLGTATHPFAIDIPLSGKHPEKDPIAIDLAGKDLQIQQLFATFPER